MGPEHWGYVRDHRPPTLQHVALAWDKMATCAPVPEPPTHHLGWTGQPRGRGRRWWEQLREHRESCKFSIHAHVASTCVHAQGNALMWFSCHLASMRYYARSESDSNICVSELWKKLPHAKFLWCVTVYIPDAVDACSGRKATGISNCSDWLVNFCDRLFRRRLCLQIWT